MSTVNKRWYSCLECGKKLSSYHSLWRHKKICSRDKQSTNRFSFDSPKSQEKIREKYTPKKLYSEMRAGSEIVFHGINTIEEERSLPQKMSLQQRIEKQQEERKKR